MPKIHTQTVAVRGEDGKDVPIGTVDVVQYAGDSWESIPVGVRAKILKDSDRQRIQDEANAMREAYKAERAGGLRGYKKALEEAQAQQDALVARLVAGEAVGAELAAVSAEVKRCREELEAAKAKGK